MQIETDEGLENDPPDTLDIETTIQSVIINKSPGTDSIRVEIYKKGTELLINKTYS